MFSLGKTHSQEIINSTIKLISEISIFPVGTFNACHASTIVELSNGKFLTAWFAGSFEGSNDVGIWISSLENNSWSSPLQIAAGYDSTGNQLPCWNPVLFRNAKNEIILFYKVGKNPREWWGMFIKSNDDGNNWSDPIRLPDGYLGPIKNKPVQISDDRIICPSSVETVDGKWSCHLEITNDDLSRWIKIEIPKEDSIGVIQPTILKHDNLKLQLLCRSWHNYIYQSWSEDGGISWSKLTPAAVPNPNSGIDAEVISDNYFILVYNPLPHGAEWYEGRNILNVAISKDGINWDDVYQLENEKDCEFSYPSIIKSSDNKIHITYTSKRKTIKHTVLQF